MQAPLNTYRQIDTLGKSQLDLILQVYDGAIRAMLSAREYYQKDDYNTGYDHLEQAKRFLTHLYTTLDNEQGGEVAGKLGELYAFVINQTNVIQASKDITALDSNVKIMKNLRDGWAGLKQQTATAQRQSSQTQAVPAGGGFTTSV